MRNCSFFNLSALSNALCLDKNTDNNILCFYFQIREENITFFSTDRFYRSDNSLRSYSDFIYTFNRPESIDDKLLINKIKSILAGEDVQCPILGREDGEEVEKMKFKLIRVDDNEVKKASKTIFVEGVHALQFEEIRKIADLSIFIKADNDLRLIRRIKRSPYYQKMIGKPADDPRNFGSSVPESFDLWENNLKPSEEKYIFPMEKNADLIVINNCPEEAKKNAEGIIKIIAD